MSKLKELGEPSEFWEYFEQITKIPRCSEHEERVRAYVNEEAERLGFESKVDNTGNLVIRIPAKQKQFEKIVLQCHLDMVCEKNEGVSHDFSKDPLELEIREINNEKWVTAVGTTLGADNGVGIAYILTLMKKISEGEFSFKSLGFDLLFTVDEERGLRGAFKIDNNLISGSYLINLDAEDENSVTIGCAGGRVTFFHIKKEVFKIKKEENLIPIKLFVFGLNGGHSGADIHLGRGNALKIIGEILWKLNRKFKIFINSINGGNRTNAIPREASANLYIQKEELSDITDFIRDLISKIKVVFNGIDPDLDISIEQLDNFKEINIFTKKIQDNILNLLYTLPNGPLSMHPKIGGLVFTSSNLGVINTDDEKIEIKLSQRSLSEYFKIVIWERAISLFNLTDLEIDIKIDSDYPGWQPNFDSTLLKLTKDAFKEEFSKEIEVKAIHAGLECGILKKKFPNMEMISIGPKNEMAHSPDERISIKSVEKIWNFLITLLGKLD
ncbi:MAG: beta-Ala-His dipeptidase [Candidatus Hermodarchaeota archaeon]